MSEEAVATYRDERIPTGKVKGEGYSLPDQEQSYLYLLQIAYQNRERNKDEVPGI